MMTKANPSSFIIFIHWSEIANETIMIIVRQIDGELKKIEVDP